jgi:hypothetical protein
MSNTNKLITLDNLTRFKNKADLSYAAKSAVETLIGSDSGKSARAIAAEELAAQLIPANAQEALNTLSEIAAWIQAHPEDAAAINDAITALQNKVDTTGTVSAAISAAISALNIGSYVKTADLGSLATKDAVAESDLSTALKEKVNAAAEGNHSHGNKTVLDDITAAKVTSWDSKAAGDHTHTPASIGAAAASHTHDYAASGHTHAYADLTGKPTIPTTVAQLSDAGNYALKTDIVSITEATEADIDALFA